MRQKIQLSILSAAISTSLLAIPSAFAQTASSNPSTAFETSFAGKTVSPDATISLTFPAELGASEGQFAVVLGSEDVTANFRWISGTQLEGVFAAMPMPIGSNALRVFRVSSSNQWQELGQAQITVAAALNPTAPGAPATTTASPAASTAGTVASSGIVRPTLIVGLKSQLAESHSAAAAPPLRNTFIDGTLQGGLQTEHSGADWSLKSAINIAGSSFQPEAVNFAALGNDAPKVDIANYLVEASYTSGIGQTALALGHIQTGNHPLLAAGIANRGLNVSHKFSPRVDVFASAQNGHQIVGGSNLLGIGDSEHRMTMAGAGFEALERPGALRLETTLFNAVVKPQLTTGVFTLQDAEQSRGWGLRAKSQNAEGSLRADAAYARSIYTPKGDSSLSILPGPSTPGHAWYVDVGYDAIKNAPAFKNFPFSLGLQAKHEYASAAYKSLGSGQAANYAADTIGLNSSLGVITGQIQLSRRADNVDDQVAFLKNRARIFSIALSAPLPQLIDPVKPPAWAPTLTYNYARNNSFADTAFIPFGQTLANLPNVKATTHGLGLNWVIDKLTLGYQLSKVFQDNEQLGQETQDVSDIGHNFAASYQFSERLNVSAGLGQRKSVLKATGVERLNNTFQTAVNWQFGNRYTLSTNISAAKDRDSILSIDGRVSQAQLQLLKLFDMNALGRKLPSQWSLSYSQSSNASLGIVVRYQTINAALSVSFF